MRQFVISMCVFSIIIKTILVSNIMFPKPRARMYVLCVHVRAHMCVDAAKQKYF